MADKTTKVSYNARMTPPSANVKTSFFLIFDFGISISSTNYKYVKLLQNESSDVIISKYQNVHTPNLFQSRHNNSNIFIYDLNIIIFA